MIGIVEALLGGYVSAEYGDTVLYALLAALVLAGPGPWASSQRSATEPASTMTTDLTPVHQGRAARLGRRASAGGPLATTGLVVVAGLVVIIGFGQQYVGSVLVLAFTYAIVTTGMAVQIGFSEQIAFSQSVFMGLGAYGAALLNTT